MKRIILILLIFIGLNLQTIEAQNLKIDEKTIIKDEEGKTIDLMAFSKMMGTGDWMINQKTDDKGNDYIQLRKSSAEEKEQIKKMISAQMKANSSIPNMNGKDAKALTLTDINGNTVTSEVTKGKVVVLNFWFIACKPFVAEIPELNKVYDKYKDNENVVFASITFDAKDKVEAFLKKHPINYPVVAGDRTTISYFSVNSYPTNMVIGKDGKIADSITGGFSEIGEHIERMIETALKAD
ncbi:MAG: TlpA family protein disulfide reductase [Winogradskyella sp.]|uniref:TlpA family protein disulfide reductase n=1 Tax=Winogradskyella sp. TaxID=1883156 RepID=UPI003858238D